MARQFGDWISRRQPRWLAIDAGLAGELLAVSVEAQTGCAPVVLKARSLTSDAWSVTGLGDLLAEWPTDVPCVAVLPRGDYQLVQVNKPPVPASELARSVLWSAGTLVDFPVELATCEVLAIPSPAGAGASATDLLTYVVLAPHMHLQPAQNAFGQAKRRLDAIDIRETAQRNIAVLFERDDECLCMLRFTQTGIQLTFTHRGDLYLDRFIAQPIGPLLSDNDFERQHAIERIGQQVNLSIRLLREQQSTLNVRRVLLAPTTTEVLLADALSAQIGLPVETADLTQVLDMAHTPDLRSAAEQARFFVALGAALRGQTI
jgi:MSHA biogenesis protein MshI